MKAFLLRTENQRLSRTICSKDKKVLGQMYFKKVLEYKTRN